MWGNGDVAEFRAAKFGYVPIFLPRILAGYALPDGVLRPPGN